MIKRIAGAVVALGLIAGTSACSVTDDDVADRSFVTLRYAGGFNEGSKFKECVEPGTKLASDDKFYRYPTSQRENVWDSDNYVDKNGDGISEGSADHKDFVTTDKDGIPISVKMKIQFFLNTDCKPKTIGGKKYEGGTIQAYHELMGKTRHAYFNADGTYDDGWIWMMNNYQTTPVQTVVRDAVRVTTADAIYKTTDFRNNTEATLQEKIQKLVDDNMQTDESFYKDFKVSVTSVTPDAGYLKTFSDRKTAQNNAETADANKKARVTEAQADAAVAKERAKVQRAEIEGFGGPTEYARLKAIEKGLNPFQPTYKVSGTN